MHGPPTLVPNAGANDNPTGRSGLEQIREAMQPLGINAAILIKQGDPISLQEQCMLHTTIEATGDATTVGILQKKSSFDRLKLRIRNFVVIDQDQIKTSHAEILAVILEVCI